MIEDRLAAFAAEGRALIIGCVDADNVPHATRGWGFRLDADGAVVLLDADDEHGIGCLAGGRPIAITAADVETLESVQFKGTSAGVAACQPVDERANEFYLEAYVRTIAEVDRIEPFLVERTVPARFVACRFTCDAVFDQTPGPRAGQPVEADAVETGS